MSKNIIIRIGSFYFSVFPIENGVQLVPARRRENFFYSLSLSLSPSREQKEKEERDKIKKLDSRDNSAKDKITPFKDEH